MTTNTVDFFLCEKLTKFLLPASMEKTFGQMMSSQVSRSCCRHGLALVTILSNKIRGFQSQDMQIKFQVNFFFRWEKIW